MDIKLITIYLMELKIIKSVFDDFGKGFRSMTLVSVCAIGNENANSRSGMKNTVMVVMTWPQVFLNLFFSNTSLLFGKIKIF